MGRLLGTPVYRRRWVGGLGGAGFTPGGAAVTLVICEGFFSPRTTTFFLGGPAANVVHRKGDWNNWGVRRRVTQHDLLSRLYFSGPRLREARSKVYELEACF